jgi:hypothetical protein
MTSYYALVTLVVPKFGHSDVTLRSDEQHLTTDMGS